MLSLSATYESCPGEHTISGSKQNGTPDGLTPRMLGGAQTSGLPLRDLRFVPKARQGVYKISLDGAPTLGVPESVWLGNNLFPLLTKMSGKSTAERC